MTRTLLLLTTWAALCSPAAEAQLQTLPIFPHSVLQRGATVAVDYGRDLDATAGVAQHLGGRATLRKGRTSLEVGAGLRDSGADPDLQAAASAGLRLLGSGGNGLALGFQLGAGYMRSADGVTAADHVAVPLAVGLALPELNASAVGLRPWIAPWVQLNRVSFAQVIVNQPGLGGSMGVDVTLPGRVGVHLGVEWSRFSDRRTSGVTLFGGSQVTVGAGAHVSLGAVTGTPAR